MANMSKVIILTGASRGIGLAVAHYLLRHSHNLVVVSRTEKALRELEKQYEGQVAVLTGDAKDLSLGKEAVDLALSRWKKLDGLIANHATLEPARRIEDTTAEEWREAYDVNLFSVVALVKAALAPLRESKGRIVLVSSGAASHAYQAWGAYGSAKAAMNHLALTLATEEEEITSMAIRPGTVDTEMQREIREKHNKTMTATDAKKFADLKSSGSLLKPEQPGHVIARAVLDAPTELNGVFLQWDDEKLKAFQ